jgi:hypothetical protein
MAGGSNLPYNLFKRIPQACRGKATTNFLPGENQ